MKKSILLFLSITIVMLAVTVNKCNAQRWIDENRGLYPQSLQVSYNYRNTGLGIRYGYIFQSVPFGLYGGFSHTFHPNKYDVVYGWERRYTLGGSITIPNRHPVMHLMGTFGGVRNEHPDFYSNMPGIVDPDINQTNNWGVDLGLQAQINHWLIGYDVGFLSDILYCQMRVGVAFYKIRKK